MTTPEPTSPEPTLPEPTTPEPAPARAAKAVIPGRLRVLVRRRSIWLALLAVGAGLCAGAVVVGLGRVAQLAHEVLFGLPPGGRLSGMERVPAALALLVPTVGGAALGLFNLGIGRWRARRPVDPIEANALHGGQMSLSDSVVVAAQTLLSNGVGASVGLEAAYTQLGSGMASRLGAAFRVRRSDLRVLVGCGSAGAIAAAFGAPLTGAFYGFEIVIAAYSPAILAPVTAAAIAGYVASVALGNHPYAIAAAPAFGLTVKGFVSLSLLGIGCALCATAIMRGVTLCEGLLKKTRLPPAALPALGGLCVGALGLLTPRVFSAGHGAFEQAFSEPGWTLGALGGLVALKVLASSVSLGAGFRGGLFFASLLLGVLLGRLFVGALGAAGAEAGVTEGVAALAGMAGLAAAIVGGPLTMSFLTLEVTGDFQITVSVLITVVVAWVTVRETFGYSFATWRFHVRGEAIRGAHDVGWVHELTAVRLMRRDAPTARTDATVAAFRAEFPLGSTPRVVVVDAESGQYAGMLQVHEAHVDGLSLLIITPIPKTTQ